MKRFRWSWLVGLVAVILGTGAGTVGNGQAWAATTQSLLGPNTDFPDADLVMPYDALAPRTTFFALSNVLGGPVDAQWVFYDQSGVKLAQVTRTALGEGGTDIVDITSVSDRTLSNSGTLVEGTAQSLAGTRGFVVVAGDGTQRLIGSFTIANVSTNAAYGTSANGMDAIGTLAPGLGLLGTTFNPNTLQDGLLIIVALNPGISSDAPVTSLTNGAAPTSQDPLMNLAISLHSNQGDGVLAEGTFPVAGSALFTSLQDLFPSVDLNTSATIVAFGAEGSAYSGSPFDPDTDSDIPLIGFYGQAVGPFGTGQNLRTLQ
jgi:hypothetical protein